MRSARNRELIALLPVALLLTAGFTAVFIQEGSGRLGNLSLLYGGYFLAICIATHIYLRIRLPYADPYLFPLMALLAAFGLVVIYRINDDLARDQANWFVLGLVLFALTIHFLRDYEVLERYRYLIATLGILLLLAPRLPGIGEQVNGAYLGVEIGSLSFQPAESQRSVWSSSWPATCASTARC
jgi:Cell cycle protein